MPVDFITAFSDSPPQVVYLKLVALVFGSEWAVAKIEMRRYLKHKHPFAVLVPYLAFPLMILASLLLPVTIVFVPFVVARFKGGVLVKLFLKILLCAFVSWLPIVYLIFGWNEDDGVKVSSTMMLTPYCALGLAGLMSAQMQLREACATAVEEMKKQLKESSSKVAQEIIYRASDPTDKRSYYPIIINSEEDEPVTELLATAVKVRVWCITAVTFLVFLRPILFFCVGMHSTGMLDMKLDKTVVDVGRLLRVGLWPWVLCLNSACMAAVLVHWFCNSVETRIKGFRDCVSQMQIFIFLSAPPDVRLSTTFRRRFQKILVANAAIRQRYADQSIESEGFRDSRIDLGIDRGGDINIAKSKKISAPDLLPEVINMNPKKREAYSLQTLRFTLNLTNRQGVELHRMLHRWMCIDVENDRFAADLAANLVLTCLFGLLIGAVLSLASHAFVPTQNHVCACLAFIVLFFYFLKMCNLCIEMNTALFNDMDIILLEWSDVASLRLVGYNYIAELWDRTKDRRKVFVGEERDYRPERIPLEVQATIETARERIRKLDKPSTLLSIVITKQLRNQILTLLITAALGALTGILKKWLQSS